MLDRAFCKELFDTKFEHQSKRIRPDDTTIRRAEEELQIPFGEEFIWILHDYGKLSYYYFEMLGLYQDAAERSALVKRTKQYRRRTNKLDNQFVFSTPNDAYAACCDSQDRVSLYSRWDDRLIPLNMSVSAYIAGEGLLAEEWASNGTENEE